MKTIYDLLNQVKVDTEDIEATPLTDLEKASMKRNFRHSVNHTAKRSSYRWAAVAACMACVVCFSQTAFAKSVLNGILQTVHVGNNMIVQMDPSQAQKPKEQFYDKDGKPITINDGTPTDIYDAKGNKMGCVVTGKTIDEERGTLSYNDINSAVKQLTFTPAFPKNLPNGYAFHHAALYKDESEKVVGDYLDLIYKKAGETLRIYERRDTQENAYALATDDKVEKTTLNGHSVAIVGDHHIVLDVNDVSIDIQANGMTRSELLAFAKTIA